MSELPSGVSVCAHYSSWASLVSELPSSLSVCVYASAFVCMQALVLIVGHPEKVIKKIIL